MSFSHRPDPHTLRLVPAASPSMEGRARPADAVFLSGGDPLAWIEEVCAWKLGAAQLDLRFYVLPVDAGALVTLPGNCPVPPPGRGQPYRVLAGRLYLPVAARLDPPVSEEELAKICRRQDTLVFHPGVGLCGFRTVDVLSLAGLLAAPPRGSELWTAACPGLTVNDRLRSVRLEAPTDLDSLFGDASRDIGSEPASTAQLPPAPGETGQGPAQAANRRLQALLARLALGFAGALPRRASAPTWVNRLEEWAGNQLERLSGELSRMRHQELHRLLHELEQNPDQGLRHAIPLADIARHRGQAPPSGKLGERDPNFRLGNLAGGKAGDSWQVPPDLHGRLRERYRQLANEETRLGRHRRAAYIHAELLGDLASAAACLKQGRHFHEAGVLYRDHLRRPLEAADCFAAGGELAQAIELYETQGRFLRVAELALALGDEPRALAAYRREVERLVAAEDLVAAANLLASRLAAPEEAVSLLRGGWPGSKQADVCLEHAFALLGKAGQHPEATDFLAELAAEPAPAGQAVALARQMATVQTTYPDEGVRHRARDLAQMTVALRLPAAGSSEVRTLLDVLGRTALGDRLLTRDGNRYLAARLDEEKQRRPVDTRPATVQLALPLSTRRQARRTGGFRLPKEVRWQQVRGSKDGFYAAGQLPAGDVVLTRACWDGFQQSVRWERSGLAAPLAKPTSLLLELPPEGAGLVLCTEAGLSSMGEVTASPRRFPVAAEPWSRIVEAGQPSWWPVPVLAATYAADGTLWLLHSVFGNEPHPVEVVLSCRSKDGGIHSQSLMLVPDAAIQPLATGEQPAHLTTVGAHLLAAGLNHLHIHTGQGWRELSFDSGILGLLPTPPLARAGCVVLLENSVALVWLDRLDAVQTVATDLASPLATFTRAGTLIVLSAEGGAGHGYDIARRDTGPMLDFAFQGDIAGVTATGERNGFAVVGTAGRVEVYTA